MQLGYCKVFCNFNTGCYSHPPSTGKKRL